MTFSYYRRWAAQKNTRRTSCVVLHSRYPFWNSCRLCIRLSSSNHILGYGYDELCLPATSLGTSVKRDGNYQQTLRHAPKAHE